MKLSTIITAAAALAGATSIATSASAVATVYESYNYSSGDYATIYVTNNDSAAYSDVMINGTDLGSLAAGATSAAVYIGDPCEGGACGVTVSVNGKASSFFTPDYDYPTTQSIGTITAVPEPAAWALMLVGFGGLGMAIRRRKALAA